MLVDPMDLEPYYELSLIRADQTTFDSFRNMWQRLQQKSSVGRYVGVLVDLRWVSFKAFLQDMGKRPEGYSLDRIDSNRGYCKDNCRWATTTEQSANRRNVTYVTDGEEILPLKAMCVKHSLDYKVVYHRIKKAGWTVDEALSTPSGGAGSNASTLIRLVTGVFNSVTAEAYRNRFRNR